MLLLVIVANVAPNSNLLFVGVFVGNIHISIYTYTSHLSSLRRLNCIVQFDEFLFVKCFLDRMNFRIYEFLITLQLRQRRGSTRIQSFTLYSLMTIGFSTLNPKFSKMYLESKVIFSHTLTSYTSSLMFIFNRSTDSFCLFFVFLCGFWKMLAMQYSKREKCIAYVFEMHMSVISANQLTYTQALTHTHTFTLAISFVCVAYIYRCPKF